MSDFDEKYQRVIDEWNAVVQEGITIEEGLLRIGLNANEVFLAIHDRLPRLKEANAGTQDPELFTCVDFFIYGILLGRRLEDEGEES